MTRLLNAWRELDREQRFAALASIGLFISMFLSWYSKTDTVVVRGAPRSAQTSLSAFEAFSFVEAAVLLVSAGVLAMLFARAEGRSFRLPGGDGLIVMVAGGWAALLIFYRLLDKPGLKGNQKISATVGVEWGIFIALLVALGLTYAGWRMRTAEHPGPPLTRPRGGGRRPRPDQQATAPVAPVGAREAEPVPARERAPYPPAPGERAHYPPAPPEQLSFEDQPRTED